MLGKAISRLRYLVYCCLCGSILPIVSVFICSALQWFKGGITNICYNCLDRNVEAGLGNKIAIYWEGNDPGSDGTLTYSQLLDQVSQVSCLVSLLEDSIYDALTWKNLRLGCSNVAPIQAR